MEIRRIGLSVLLLILLGTLSSCGFFGNRVLGQGKGSAGNEEWLTEYEAYEDQKAHTAMDGGAMVTTGLKIRNLPDFCWTEEDYTPEKYAIRNGGFQQLESGEVVYIRFSDGLQRGSIWAWGDGKKCYYLDENGFLARNRYAVDGFYAGSDGSWDRSVTRKQPQNHE